MPKFRQKYGQFVVEGRKAVEEVFHSGWHVEGIWATQAFVDRHAPNYPHERMSEEENKKCTAFDTAPGVMALVRETLVPSFAWQIGLGFRKLWLRPTV